MGSIQSELKALMPIIPLETGESMSLRENTVALARAATPARILMGRAGPSYRTRTQLELRRDHAAAQDAVLSEFNLDRDFSPEMVARFVLFHIQTQARSKSEYLLRPDLGRRLSIAAETLLQDRCPRQAGLQLVIGDGLSAEAVRQQVPQLLPTLYQMAVDHGWQVGQPFCVRYCRVGVLNEIGRILEPQVVVLLIGERPGLATAESLSAYFAWQPRPGHTDANRNLISNIHSRGITVADAAERILGMAAQIRRHRSSSALVKEQ